eukprot:gene3300-4133_t
MFNIEYTHQNKDNAKTWFPNLESVIEYLSKNKVSLPIKSPGLIHTTGSQNNPKSLDATKPKDEYYDRILTLSHFPNVVWFVVSPFTKYKDFLPKSTPYPISSKEKFSNKIILDPSKFKDFLLFHIGSTSSKSNNTSIQHHFALISPSHPNIFLFTNNCELLLGPNPILYFNQRGELFSISYPNHIVNIAIVENSISLQNFTWEKKTPSSTYQFSTPFLHLSSTTSPSPSFLSQSPLSLESVNNIKRYYSYSKPTWEIEDEKLNYLTNEEEESIDHTKTKKGLLWVNNLYPIKVSRLDLRSLVFHIPITKRIHSMFPPDVKIISIEKRIKEGGAYIHFEFDPNETNETVEQVGERLIKTFEVANKHFHFANKPAKAMMVEGRPFVEDIDYRIPSTTLRITFKGSEMMIDDVYRLLRPFGHIRDIYYTPSQAQKDQPRQVMVVFNRMEGSIASRNSLHNKYFKEYGSTLYMEYEQMMRINKLKDYFSKHPKIMIPLAGILATLITLLLLNPLREFFIKRKLTEPFYFEEMDDWQTRVEEKTLNVHFSYPPNSIVMISAPKGSGKSSLIDKIIEGRPNTLLVDCNLDVNNNDEEFIENFCKQIGFFPSYGFYSNAGAWIDAIIPTGKGAFHSSTSYQLQTILKLLDDCLLKKAEDFPPDPHLPYTYPLIVIDGFFGMIAGMENKEKANIIMDSIIQWSITSTQRGHSHVVFISSDPFAGDILKKYLDNRGGGQVTTMHLGDVPPNDAKRYIKNKVGSMIKDETELDTIVGTLGGRYYDLNALSQRLISGEPIQSALTSMIAKSVGEIRAEGFGLSKRNDSLKKEQIKWSRSQLWETIKRIADKNLISYDDLLFNVFMGDETSLNNLINHGILRFQSIDNERMVTAYSPLYCSAFKQMVEDLEFHVGMDILVQKSRIEEELAKLSKVEDELLKIKTLSESNWFEPAAIKKRRVLLEDKMKDHVAKIEVRENILKSHYQFQKYYQQQKVVKKPNTNIIEESDR